MDAKLIQHIRENMPRFSHHDTIEDPPNPPRGPTVVVRIDGPALNIYGDETHHKPFPDISEKIRADGAVFALRDITA